MKKCNSRSLSQVYFYSTEIKSTLRTHYVSSKRQLGIAFFFFFNEQEFIILLKTVVVDGTLFQTETVKKVTSLDDLANASKDFH